MSSDYDKFKMVTETAVEELHPELKGFYYPVYALVKGLRTDLGSCNIKVLDKVGSEIDEIQTLPFVKIPDGMPVTLGAKVRVIFDYADLNKPVIVGVV